MVFTIYELSAAHLGVRAELKVLRRSKSGTPDNTASQGDESELARSFHAWRGQDLIGQPWKQPRICGFVSEHGGN